MHDQAREQVIERLQVKPAQVTTVSGLSANSRQTSTVVQASISPCLSPALTSADKQRLADICCLSHALTYL